MRSVYLSSIIYFTTVITLIYTEVTYAQDKYRFTIDLVNVQDDKVNVALQCPLQTGTTIRYFLPKIVPGTYAIYDFGRFIDNFSATDAQGNALEVRHDDANSWTISNASQLSKITYSVNDSYDAHDKDNPIFEPAGSNIQKDSNYVINSFAFAGYFESQENIPYELTVLHRPDFFGSTAMTDEDESNTVDRHYNPDYRTFADNPIMYNIPDTATVRVGNCNVLISVYSPLHDVSAAYVAGKLDTLLQAQGKYLGGTLPVNKYAFIVYLDQDEGISGGQGALEHSYCSMYYMPELPQEIFISYFSDYAAHEFFHIITPLSIHSEEIQYFDFSQPKISEHLWLYEGTTEYHAHLVQEKYKLITPDDFLEVLRNKINTSKFRFNDTLPFTELSKGCLDRYKYQYVNVYMKGALIAMCIDIRLRYLSGGKYGIQQLMQDLSKEYGKNRPFKDDELFDKIGQLTYPSITDFLKKYVAGTSPLPLDETFKMVGVEFTPKIRYKDFNLGKVSLVQDPANGRARVSDISGMNDFGRAIGYREGDELISVNGNEIFAHNYVQVKNAWLASVKEGDPIIIMVDRKKSNGNSKMVKLKATVVQTENTAYNLLTFSETPTTEQLQLRNAWLNP